MSELTGFTHANCTIAFDAIVQIITETLLGGRGIYLFKLGWIEPYKRPPRKMYRIDDKMGVLLDENGEKILTTYDNEYSGKRFPISSLRQTGSDSV